VGGKPVIYCLLIDCSTGGLNVDVDCLWNYVEFSVKRCTQGGLAGDKEEIFA
jgi:hypothetical protein